MAKNNNCGNESDILKEISDGDLLELAETYKKYEEELPHVINFLKTAIKSKICGMKDYVQVMSPNNSWKEDGTFIALIRSNSLNCQAFLHTLDKNGKKLAEALTKTKIIPLTGKNKGFLMFYGVHEDLNGIVETVLKKEKHLEFFDHGKWTTGYCLKKDLAIKLNPKLPLNTEVYVNTLDVRDAEIINDTWPHKSEGSVDFVRDIIKLNKGFGLYLKSNNELVSWTCISVFGQMSLLYTLPGHRKKGYGTFLTHYTAKYLAEVENMHTIGTIVVENKVSEKMFLNAGFRRIYKFNYIAVHM